MPVSPSPIDNVCDVESALRQALPLSAHTIEWQLTDSTLVLRGRVQSFYHKQLVTIAARRLPGIDKVINELEVEHRATGRRPLHDE